MSTVPIELCSTLLLLARERTAFPGIARSSRLWHGLLTSEVRAIKISPKILDNFTHADIRALRRYINLESLHLDLKHYDGDLLQAALETCSTHLTSLTSIKFAHTWRWLVEIDDGDDHPNPCYTDTLLKTLSNPSFSNLAARLIELR
jgi:hypothetical protein